MLNVFDIRDMPEICHWWFKDSVKCNYHYSQEIPLTIFAEYNIMFEAQYLYQFTLKEDKGIFLLKVLEQYEVDVHVAGNSLESAIEFMLDQIMQKTGPTDKTRIQKIRQDLKQVLLS
jgi:hypothetical protein